MDGCIFKELLLFSGLRLNFSQFELFFRIYLEFNIYVYVYFDLWYYFLKWGLVYFKEFCYLKQDFYYLRQQFL